MLYPYYIYIFSLYTIELTDHCIYLPSSLSTIKPINHQAHWPSSLSTSGLLSWLLSLSTCFHGTPYHFVSEYQVICEMLGRAGLGWISWCIYLITQETRNWVWKSFQIISLIISSHSENTKIKLQKTVLHLDKLINDAKIVLISSLVSCNEK